MYLKNRISRIDPVNHAALRTAGIILDMLREDELHEQISGNKYRKLKYNLQRAKELGKHTLLTFGGAYSNHIAATAAAGAEFGFKTIGIIRGDELAHFSSEKLWSNPTLHFAKSQGMQFEFVSRTAYREKTSQHFLDALLKKFGDFYMVPEGGTNAFAVRGCEEILDDRCADYDVICVAVGTGGTISGLINSCSIEQKIIGFPALKGNFLEAEINKYVLRTSNWSLNTSYSFGGYGKVSEELITFINGFKARSGIPLDPVYTGKMLFGIVDLVKEGYFARGTKILAVHTGGLQGIEGMNRLLEKRNWTLID